MALAPFFTNLTGTVVSKGYDARSKFNVSGGCDVCGLFKQCQTPRMEASGEGKKGILILAEAPGAAEDKKGIQLIGKSGQLLREELERMGIDLDNDCRKLNAVNCRPPGNRTPTDKEIALCRHKVMAEIDSFKPTAILALGGPAMKSLVQHRGQWDTGFPSIGNWQGEQIPDQELNAYIFPTFHPAYVLRNEKHPIYLKKWRNDLRQLGKMYLNRPQKLPDYQEQVEVILDPHLAARRLKQLYNELLLSSCAQVALDYETTGLKPYAEGHRIVCASLAWNHDMAISFLMTPETWPCLYNILRDPRIKIMAHHMKFENLWSRVRGQTGRKEGFHIHGWSWCSMMAAHILDNRPGKAGLKFQTYAKFGVIGYDDAISYYLKSAGKNANGFNRIDEAPVRDLLLYCGADSLFEYRLAMKQQLLIFADQELTGAYRLFHEGALALCDAEINGIHTDREYCRVQFNHLERRIQYLRTQVMESAEVKKWQAIQGKKFNLDSGPQLSHLLFKVLRHPVVKLTKGGSPSVDADVLESLDVPFIKHLLQIRKLEKIKSTYLTGFIEEAAADGKLHPFFHLHKVVSYRSSSDRPNFQNIPKRDKEAQKTVRRALKAAPGHVWVEVDYSGVEVRIATTYHKDPTMINYLNDARSDMHRDAASDLFILPADDVTKNLRQGGKNGFVFPEFYGDWYEHCAQILWNTWVLDKEQGKLKDGSQVRDHLFRKGIQTYEQFVNHVKRVENIFWNERFHVYNDWRDDHWNMYLKRGFFRAHTGFIYNAIMNRNDAINYGTQGAAFHCLLWSFTRINEYLKKGRWKSYLIGQIHDSIEFSMAIDEINHLLPVVRKIMVDDLMAHFQWINVPIDVEIEMSPLNKSWYELKEVKNRTKACSCGIQWGYELKEPDGIYWSCPVCGETDFN